VSELNDGHLRTWTLDPRSLGIPYARLSDLGVSTVDEAADALRRIFGGEPGPRRDIAVLNAAAALVVAGKAKDLREGLALANDALTNGNAQRTLDTLIRCST
jgi:anthranilate phosphoribosyltransferase